MYKKCLMNSKRNNIRIQHSTDESLSPNEVIKTYFEKDFVEKFFRTLKTFEEIEPVRHRLEQRVRAQIFVCVLAFRLLADLQYRLIKISGSNGAQEQVDDLLRELERVQVRLGHQVKTWYLNVTRKTLRHLRRGGPMTYWKKQLMSILKCRGGKSKLFRCYTMVNGTKWSESAASP